MTFSAEEVSEKGVIKKIGKKDKLTYIEYADRMHKLSLRKRAVTTNRRKIHCENARTLWNAKPIKKGKVEEE